MSSPVPERPSTESGGGSGLWLVAGQRPAWRPLSLALCDPRPRAWLSASRTAPVPARAGELGLQGRGRLGAGLGVPFELPAGPALGLLLGAGSPRRSPHYREPHRRPDDAHSLCCVCVRSLRPPPRPRRPRWGSSPSSQTPEPTLRPHPPSARGSATTQHGHVSSSAGCRGSTAPCVPRVTVLTCHSGRIPFVLTTENLGVSEKL